MNPQFNEGSAVRFYSLGIVTEDKTDDGDLVKVTPIEELPQVLGVLSDAKFDYDVKGTNHQGVDVSTSVKGVAFVVAKWKNFGGDNRNTAPNVYENETVLLIKYGSHEQVYWHKIGREPMFRRLENAIYTWSNLEVKGEEHDLETSIFLQVSTRDQRVQLHIPDNRGEKSGYDMIFDMAAGTFHLYDTHKNSMFWDSVNGDLKIDMNRSVEVNTQEIRFNGSTYVRTKAPEITETGDDITNNASATAVYKSGGPLTSQAGALNNIKGATTIIEAGAPVIIRPGVAVG